MSERCKQVREVGDLVLQGGELGLHGSQGLWQRQ
jgi:hypothetical protein